MKENPTIIFRVTNNCNLDCVYCYDKKNHSNIYNESKIIKSNIKSIVSTIEKIWINKSIKANLIFHGGEPLLVNANTYRLLIEEIIKLYPNASFSIQTNGTLLSKEHIRIFKKYNVNIGISLDGCNEQQNQFRIYSNGKNCFNKVMEKIELLKNEKARFGIIITLTKAILGHERELYDFIAANRLRCNIRPAFLSDNNIKNFALTNEEYSIFFKNLFDIWLNDDRKIDLTQINEMYEEFAKCLDNNKTYGNCSTCGECFGKFISLDAIGNIYSCNRTYENEKFYYGNINNMTREELALKCDELNKIRKSYLEGSKCKDCALFNECHGGCPANAYTLHKDICSADDYFCDSKLEIKKYIQSELKNKGLVEEYNKLKNVENASV